jgi:hypothetical protein
MPLSSAPDTAKQSTPARQASVNKHAIVFLKYLILYSFLPLWQAWYISFYSNSPVLSSTNALFFARVLDFAPEMLYNKYVNLSLQGETP